MGHALPRRRGTIFCLFSWNVDEVLGTGKGPCRVLWDWGHASSGGGSSSLLLKQEDSWLVLAALSRCEAMLTGLAVPGRFRMAQQRMSRT